MNFAVVASLAVFIAILMFLFNQQQKQNTLSRLVLIGLVTGSLFGLGLQLIHGEGSDVIGQTLECSASQVCCHRSANCAYRQL